jgi:Metal binding domain of Ada
MHSVATTGVFCRPSCPSRTANPKNIRFHDSPASARAAGFRPCKRCKPEGASVDAQNAILVVLSLVLPLPMVALVILSSRKSVTGDFVTGNRTAFAAIAATLLIVLLNIVLIRQTLL